MKTFESCPKSFCVSGPIGPTDHYFVPFHERVPSDFLATMKDNVFSGNYFAIRAPRQTGKTSFMWWFTKDVLDGTKLKKNVAEDALMEFTICSVFVDFQPLGGGNASVRDIVETINFSYNHQHIDTAQAFSILQGAVIGEKNILLEYLRKLCSDLFAEKKLLVLIIDEVDALTRSTGKQF